MKFIADLHIHSKYSMATSKQGDLPHLYHWARIKGIDLVGTGDFTHPQWFKELKENLIPTGTGLFTLKPDAIKSVESEFPFSPKESISPAFILSTEISNVYKKNGKVRKNHNVVLFDNLDSVDKLRKKLEKIGNITYDGRPMLGLDAKDLLDIVLSISPNNMFIPAHIWTPWFSLFGSKSGFDSIYDCFGDLTNNITALETGLSSDPPMNWMKSELDQFNLVSNSDAHSPQKLGREVNLFNSNFSFNAIKKSLEDKTSNDFLGTLEFYPEEGKYHNDGHRNCGINMTPEEALQHNNICPVCGKPLTIGVLHRVVELADRPYNQKPKNSKSFESIIPLQQILSHILNYTTVSKKIKAAYEHLINNTGSEFFLLRDAPIELIEKNSNPLIAEGIKRIREGKVKRIPGFDGEFGKISLFTEEEKSELSNQSMLFQVKKPKKTKTPQIKNEIHSIKSTKKQANTKIQLSKTQKIILESEIFPTAVVAGPGTGKTFLLVEKIKHLKTSKIIAITFTKKSAEEIKTRLTQKIEFIGTIHKLSLKILKQFYAQSFEIITPRDSLFLLEELKITKKDLNKISFLKSSLIKNANVKEYNSFLNNYNLLDLDDIIIKATEILQSNKKAQDFIKNSADFLFVDEFQDVNKSQYLFIQTLSKILNNKIFIIGDPEQTIYQFRGSIDTIFETFSQDFSAKTFFLKENFRSTTNIITVSNNLMNRDISAHSKRKGAVTYHTFPTELSEGIFVAKEISRLIGGQDMIEAHRLAKSQFYSFSDIAILVRTENQIPNLEYTLTKQGIPYKLKGAVDFFEEPSSVFLIHLLKFLYQDNLLSFKILVTSKLLSLPKNQQTKILNTKSFNIETDNSILKMLHTLCLDKNQFKNDINSLLSKLNTVLPINENILSLAKKETKTLNFLNTLLFHKDSDIEIFKNHYKKEGVSLVTMHSAKGLEFPVVFLPGIEEGIIPYKKDEIESEKKLFYVALTRAKEILYITNVKKRKIYNKIEEREPSQFLLNLPLTQKIVKMKSKEEQLKLF